MPTTRSRRSHAADDAIAEAANPDDVAAQRRQPAQPEDSPMPKTLLPALACAVLLSACGPAMTKPEATTPAPAPEAPSRGSCDATKAQSFVGQKGSADVQEQARSASGASMARTLQPGQAITKEFNGERLNLYVDEANTITRINCG
jgi:hypothetical protein